MSQISVETNAMKIQSSFFAVLEKTLPAIFDRETASLALGGVLSPKTLSNADAQGTGPEVRMKLGKKIVYERESFLLWLQTRLK